MLYRKRSGGILCGSTVPPIAGAFSILPLEVSRFGTATLWDLNVRFSVQIMTSGRFEAQSRTGFRPFAEHSVETPMSGRRIEKSTDTDVALAVVGAKGSR